MSGEDDPIGMTRLRVSRPIPEMPDCYDLTLLKRDATCYFEIKLKRGVRRTAIQRKLDYSLFNGFVSNLNHAAKEHHAFSPDDPYSGITLSTLLDMAIEKQQRIISYINREEKRHLVEINGDIEDDPDVPPPGIRLDRCLQFLCSKKDYNQIFSQVIIDMRVEYSEALANNEKHKARWILVRSYLTVAWVWIKRLGPIGVIIGALIKKLSSGS